MCRALQNFCRMGGVLPVGFLGLPTRTLLRTWSSSRSITSAMRLAVTSARVP